MEDIAFLSTVSLLREFDRSELAAIGRQASSRTYETGSVILDEGSPNRSFHIVYDGRVRVSRRVDDKEVNLCDLCTGETFGEMSILGDGVVTATLKAIPRTTVLSLSVDDLAKVLQENPQAAAKFWHAIARDLRDRLIQSNDVVKSYFEVNRALVDNPAFREAYAMCNR